jgi:hypothetical protein
VNSVYVRSSQSPSRRWLNESWITTEDAVTTGSCESAAAYNCHSPIAKRAETATATEICILHVLFFRHIILHSAYNHKRASAGKCRESHHRYRGTAQQCPFCGGVTHGILQRWRAYDCTHSIIILSSWLQIQRSGFDFRHYQILLEEPPLG